MGWQWSEFAGHRAVGHGGSHVGATYGLWIVPESKVIVAVATNTNAPSGIVDHLIASVIEVALD